MLTTPLTYFPRTKSTPRTLDSTARYRSLTPTRTSIFRSPRLSLVCSASSLKLVTERKRARRDAEDRRTGACTLVPPMPVATNRALAVRSCFDNATRPSNKKMPSATGDHVFISRHTPLIKKACTGPDDVCPLDQLMVSPINSTGLYDKCYQNCPHILHQLKCE